MDEDKRLQPDRVSELEPDPDSVRVEIQNIMSSAEDPSDGEAVFQKEEASPDKKPAKSQKPANSAKKTVLTYLHDFVYLLAAVLLVFLLCLRVVVVSGPSMNDTLVNGDYLLLVNNLFFSDYQRGDVIVASKDSFRDGEPIVKRVIATEGQVVDINFATGTVTVDGVVLKEPYISTSTNLDEGVSFPLTVKPGHLFVMGDNRNNSKDSRSPEIGQVDCREVLGKAIFLLIPGGDMAEKDFNRIGVVR